MRPGIEGVFTGDNAAFGNYVQDLTIDVGAGNPGAVGVRWAAANTGSLERVTIRATSGTSGLRGISLESSTGPSLVQDVTVEGFDVGIWADTGPVNNTAFSHITLTNQRSVAIQNRGKAVQFEGLTVNGAPKVYDASGRAAVGQFIDVDITGKGSGTAFTAVADSYLYVRNVAASSSATSRHQCRHRPIHRQVVDHRVGVDQLPSRQQVGGLVGDR